MLRQYSFTIKIIKNALGILAALLIFSVFVLPLLFHKNDRVNFSTATPSSAIREANKVVYPKLYGKDNKNRPYIISADYGTQMGNNQVQLFKIKGKINLDENLKYYELFANQGDASENSSIIHLIGDVMLINEHGYTSKTQEAYVDYKKSSAYGNTAISILAGKNELKANKFQILPGAEVYKFQGNVAVFIRP